MRRGLAISFCILHSAFCIAESPLALMRSATDPSRMSAGDVVFELPAHFADGRETSATMLCWLRFECPRFDPAETAVPPALMAWASHSHEPARATLEGGDELPAFLDLARVPLSPSATWGASGIVPQDAAEVPGAGVYEGRFIVCVNVDTTHDITLTVGGSELEIPATNGFVRNLEVCKGDTSVTVAAASAAASVRLALAVNPWRQFFAGPAIDYMRDGDRDWPGTGITNCWTLLAWRGELRGGRLYETFDVIDREGVAFRRAGDTAYPAAAFVRDSRFRWYFSCMCGTVVAGVRRRIEAYGYRTAPRALTDAEIWRAWELDLAEIRRRGIDTALPPR